MILYSDLLDILKNAKGNPLLFISDLHGGTHEARLGFRELTLIKYDNDKLIQKKSPEIRVIGNPIGEVHGIFLTIIPGNRENTLEINPFKTSWVKYLEGLSPSSLAQEVIVCNPDNNYYADLAVVIKGGIGYSRCGVSYKEKTGEIKTSRTRNEEEDNKSVDWFAKENNETPYHWGECLIFDRNNPSTKSDAALFNPSSPPQVNMHFDINNLHDILGTF